MNDFERRFREMTGRLTQWFGSGTKAARQRRADRTADLRQQASVRAQQAAAKVQDFRQSERGQKAEARFRDLRASETGQKAEGALSDLRQREPVKKAEESARKVMNDLFSGRSDS